MSTTMKQLESGKWLIVHRTSDGFWRKSDLFQRPLIVCASCNTCRPEWEVEAQLSSDFLTPCCEELS